MGESQSFWFLIRSDTNLPVQLQKKDRSLKVWVLGDNELYYSEKQGVDQLYSASWFMHRQKSVFLKTWLK